MAADNGTVAPSSTLNRLLTDACWFGLLAGLLEAAALSIKKFYLGHLLKAGDDFIWMAPVAALSLLLAVAVPFVLLVTVLGSDRRVRLAAIGAFAFVAAFNVVLLSSAMAVYAKALIAAGLAAQASRMIARRTVLFDRIVARTLPWMAASVVVLIAGLFGWRWIEYRGRVAAEPQPDARAPNVLLVVLDTVRARSLSLYGYPRPTTPNLERWAASAVVFDRAIAPTSWTFPSHASMFTGRWPDELSADWQTPLDARHPTLAEVLRDRGYLTAGFAANIFYCTAEFGMARGFLHYEDFPISPSQLLVSTAVGRELFAFSLNTDSAFRVREAIGYQEIPGRRNATQINDAFLTWLDRQDTSRPFFAFVNYLDAHQPFLPPEPFGTRFRGDRPRGNPTHFWDRRWTADELQAERDAYDGTIAYLDSELERLAGELRRRGQFENTIIVVTSDHGEHFGEHGFMRHGNTLYLDVLHVPLVISFPGKTTAVRVRDTVSLRDLPPTALAMANIACDGCFPSQSLTRYWIDPSLEVRPPTSPGFSELKQGVRIPERYPNAKGDMESLVAEDWHYIVNSQGAEELYDLSRDPDEQTNLASMPGAADTLARMRRDLESVRSTTRR